MSASDCGDLSSNSLLNNNNTKKKKVLFHHDVRICQLDDDGHILSTESRVLAPPDDATTRIKCKSPLYFRPDDDDDFRQTEAIKSEYNASHFKVILPGCVQKEMDGKNTVTLGLVSSGHDSITDNWFQFESLMPSYRPLTGKNLPHYNSYTPYTQAVGETEYNRPIPPSRLTVTVPDHPIDFHIVQDPLRGSLLVFCVPLGTGYDPKSIMVRANKTGKKISVFACSKRKKDISSRSFGSGGPGNGGVAVRGEIARDLTTIKQEYCERFTLPCRVDSERLQARVDMAGYLKVEAAITDKTL